MFFMRRRVEEDLERIRRANLPDEARVKEDTERAEAKAAAQDLGAKDIFAMILAVLSLVLPYFLVLAAVIVGIILLLGVVF